MLGPILMMRMMGCDAFLLCIYLHDNEFLNLTKLANLHATMGCLVCAMRAFCLSSALLSLDLKD